MLDKLFDLENPVMRFLSDLFDLVVLNIITVLLCIPVVTAVPALTAMHYMALKIARGEQSYIIKPYFKSFKDNLKQSFLIGLGFIAAGLVMYMDWRVIWGAEGLFPSWVRIVFTAAAAIVIMLMLWVIPLQSHFENPIRATLRNSVLMSIGNFPRTLLMVIVWTIPVVLFLASYQLWPIVFMLGLSGPAFVCAKIYSPVFKRYEPEEDEMVSDEMFEMQDEDLEAFSRDLHAAFDAGEDTNDKN